MIKRGEHRNVDENCSEEELECGRNWRAWTSRKFDISIVFPIYYTAINQKYQFVSAVTNFVFM